MHFIIKLHCSTNREFELAAMTLTTIHLKHLPMLLKHAKMRQQRMLSSHMHSAISRHRPRTAVTTPA